MTRKQIRLKIWRKYNNKCAYCGHKLEFNKMQADHKVPIFRNSSDAALKRMNIERGEDSITNLVPSCMRCNQWKSTYTLENFRIEISKQRAKLLSNSNYKMARDFNLIKENNNKVVFWFEIYDKSH